MTDDNRRSPDAKGVCPWGLRIGYDCALSEGHYGDHKALCDGYTVSWKQGTASEYRRPSEAPKPPGRNDVRVGGGPRPASGPHAKDIMDRVLDEERSSAEARPESSVLIPNAGINRDTMQAVIAQRSVEAPWPNDEMAFVHGCPHTPQCRGSAKRCAHLPGEHRPAPGPASAQADKTADYPSAIRAAGFRYGPSLHGEPTLWCVECRRDSGFHWPGCSKDFAGPLAEKVRELDALRSASASLDDAHPTRAPEPSGPLDALQIISRDRDVWKQRWAQADIELQRRCLESAPGEQTITLPLSPNEDTEVTCLYCRAERPCEYGLTIRRQGETALVGLHATCLEPFRAKQRTGSAQADAGSAPTKTPRCPICLGDGRLITEGQYGASQCWKCEGTGAAQKTSGTGDAGLTPPAAPAANTTPAGGPEEAGALRSSGKSLDEMKARLTLNVLTSAFANPRDRDLALEYLVERFAVIRRETIEECAKAIEDVCPGEYHASLVARIRALAPAPFTSKGGDR